VRRLGSDVAGGRAANTAAWGAKTTDLDTICGGSDREDGKTPVNADESTAVGGGGRLMTALGMEVGR
jgi:hypothetical protein